MRVKSLADGDARGCQHSRNTTGLLISTNPVVFLVTVEFGLESRAVRLDCVLPIDRLKV